MQNCDVSVVIPAYNAEKFIVDALDSIAGQTRLPSEVFVVDDGSMDNTHGAVGEWIDRVGPTFSVKLIRQQNAGSPATRNAGIRLATCTWIALLDADDIWEPWHLEVLLNAVELVPTSVAAYGAGQLFIGEKVQDLLYDDFWDNPSKKFGRSIVGSEYLMLNNLVFSRLLKGNFVKPSSLMFKAEVTKRIGLWDETLRTAEDREFMIRLIFEGDLVYYPKSITRYRWHDENLSQVKNAKRNLENGLRVLDKIINNRSLALSPAQRGACQTEISGAIKEYLYVCSLAGWQTYKGGLGMVRSLFGEWSAIKALNAKHIVHTMKA